MIQLLQKYLSTIITNKVFLYIIRKSSAKFAAKLYGECFVLCQYLSRTVCIMFQNQKQEIRCSVCIYFTCFKSSVAGLSIREPFSVKREPWQGQSHVCSDAFHFNAQPMWGHRFFEKDRRLAAASTALTASCGRSMVLEGEKTGA